jgi:hypothetical protein
MDPFTLPTLRGRKTIGLSKRKYAMHMYINHSKKPFYDPFVKNGKSSKNRLYISQ